MEPIRAADPDCGALDDEGPDAKNSLQVP